MQILILADLEKKHVLQQILTWGNGNKGISYQMCFPKNLKTLNYILKNVKYDMIVTTNLKVSFELGKRNITPFCYVNKDFNDFSKHQWVKNGD